MRKLIITLVVFLVLISNAYALGVSPGRTTLDFQPGAEHEITFTIVNSEAKDIQLEIFTEDTSGIVRINEKKIQMKADEERREVKVKVKMPEKIKPGINDIDIIIKQLPSDIYPSPLFVEANIGVVSQIRIRVPYPGKYVDVGDVEVKNARVNSTVEFNIPVINFGNLSISKLQAKIKLIDPENKTISEILSQETSLEPNRRVLLNAQWNSQNLKPGVYGLEAVVTFDEETTGKTKRFTLGRMYIKLVKVETGNDYKFGGIAKLDMTLLSEWNEDIENVYGELKISDKDKNEIADLKTASIDLPPYDPKILNAFWDTANAKEGQYFLNLILRYNGIEQNINMITDLSFNGLNTRIIGATGEAIATPITAKTILPIAVVLLVVINIGIVIYYRRKSKLKQKNKGQE